MPSITVPVALGAAAVVGAGASVYAANKQSSAAKQAGNLQYKAAQDAATQQMAMFQQMQGNLKPYMTAGTNALTQMQGLTGTNPGGNPLTAPLTAPFEEWNPTQAGLEATPGYQFALSQGLKAGQNRLTVQGLGESGPAVTGAIDYATGMASGTYQQQFQNYNVERGNYWNQNQSIYNMLAGITQTGQNAAAGTGVAGIQTGGAISNLMTGGAAALGAGGLGSANAWAQGATNIGSGIGNAGMMLAMTNNGMYGPTASWGGTPTEAVMGPGGNYIPGPGGFTDWSKTMAGF